MTSVERALAITGRDEGAGWGGVSNAGDGMGWSAFCLQWNFGQGTLQPLLLAMQSANPSAFVLACTVDGRNMAPELISACRLPKEEGVKWCKTKQDGEGRPLPQWKQVFSNLGNVSNFREIQLKFAESYINSAKRYMEEFGFKSDRAFCLLFDICVQEGSVSPASMARYESWSKGMETEHSKVITLAKAVGPQAGPYEEDVESRKLEIAKGQGKVHGESCDLDKVYGLNDGPVVYN